MNKNYYYTTYGVYLLFFFAPFLSQAQKAPDIEWSKLYGGSLAESPQSIKSLPNGGYIVVGQTSSNNGDVITEKTIANLTNSDWWIVELDREGNIVRQAVYGNTTGAAGLYDVLPLEEGGYIVLGYINASNGDFADVNFKGGSWDAAIAKLNDTLGIEWVKNFGGSGTEELYSIDKTADGGYIASGYTSSEDGDVKNKQNGTTNDWWIVKFDAQFNIQHEKTFGGSGPSSLLMNEAAMSIVPLKNGDTYAVAGTTNSNDGDLEGLGLGNDDACVLILNDTLGTVWVKTFGGAAADRFTSIIQTSDENLVIAGQTASIDGTMEGLIKGGTDIWLTKLNLANGAIIWSELYGSTGNERFGIWETLIQTKDGGLLFTAQTNRADGDVSVLRGGTAFDMWVVKLGETGIIEWEKTFGGSSIEFGGSVIEQEDGGFIIASRSNSNNGDVSGQNKGNYDVWVLKLHFCTEEVSVSATICTNENYDFNGRLLTGAGAYIDTLQTIGGCDSIVTLTLEVVPAPATPTITADGNELSTKEFASYQWILDGLEIDGATSRQYNASIYGDYQVIISNGICSDTSEVYALSPATSINSTAWSESLNVYPNPADNELTILYDSQGYSVSISNLSGQEQLQTQATGNAKIDINNLSPGMYILKILENGEIKAVQKIIKE